MSQSENNPYKPFQMLGIAMMVPVSLVSGPLAAYLLWRFIGTKFLGLSSIWMVLFVVIGMAASAIHVSGLIKRIQDSESKR